MISEAENWAERTKIPFGSHPVVLKLCAALRDIKHPNLAQEIEEWDWDRPCLQGRNARLTVADPPHEIFDRLFNWATEQGYQPREYTFASVCLKLQANYERGLLQRAR
jgi:hypothetical protein